jgi:putative tryptophan/tyrosine transport system substrate-binding protein
MPSGVVHRIRFGLLASGGYVQRRDFIALLGGVFNWSFAAHAQQKAMPVVGFLSIFSRPANPGDLLRGPIHQGMGEMGFVEGQNMVWEYHWAHFHHDLLPALAADLVTRKVDVIVTAAGLPPALAAKNATSTIPIVFTDVGDPVGFGLVASLARPGGNLTGFSNLTVELMPKRIELLCELIPQAAVIALLVNPDNEVADQVIRTTQEAAHAKGIQLTVLKATTEAEINAAFDQLKVGGLLVASDPFFGARITQVVALAARHAVPAMYWRSGWVAAGGLISYGADIDALYREAGIYAGRILKGAKPADLPVPQPTTFKLVVNLKTAQALGLTVPPSILARADEVIE